MKQNSMFKSINRLAKRRLLLHNAIKQSILRCIKINFPHSLEPHKAPLPLDSISHL